MIQYLVYNLINRFRTSKFLFNQILNRSRFCALFKGVFGEGGPSS